MDIEEYVPHISFLVIFLFIVLIIYNITNRRTYVCSILDNTKPQKDLTSTELNDTLLLNLHINSAYNCCCIGGIKNDYVDLCALKYCFNLNIRCLDFQIFSLNEEPIIAASTNKSFEYKEIYNYLSLTKTLNEVNQLFCTKYQVHSNLNSPLFLNFRINSNNKSIFDKIHKYIINSFNQSYSILMPEENKRLQDYTFQELHNKVVIMVDIGESIGNRGAYEKSSLPDITMITFGINGSSIRASDSVIDTYNELSCIYPNVHPNSMNYNSIRYGFNYNYNFIYMNQQTNDAFLKEHNNKFNKSSFITMG